MDDPSRDAWDDLRLFLAACEAGSLSAAAARLGLAQATLSRRIAALEARTGHLLFDRTRKGLVPTAAALALLPHAEGMAAAAAGAEAALAGLEVEAAGVVRIAVPEGLAADLLPGVLPELARRHPRVRLAVVVGNAAVDLGRREADLAIRSLRPEGEDLLLRRLPDVPIGLYAAPSLLARLPRPPRLEDLPLVQWSEDLGHIPLARWTAALLGDRPPALTANSFLALRAAAVAGVGAMALPSFQAQLAGLAPVPLALPPVAPVAWYLVVPRPLRQVPRVAAVVDLVVEAIETGVATGTWPPRWR